MKNQLTSILLFVFLFSIIIPLYLFSQNGVKEKNNNKVYHKSSVVRDLQSRTMLL